MPTSKSTAHTPRRMAPRCAAMPGLLYARRDPGRAAAELARVAKLADDLGGLVPRTEKDHHPDAMANLWFIRAVHALGAAILPGENHAAFPQQAAVLADVLIPQCKKIVQQFISDKGIDGLRMDDGGLLTPGGHPSPAHAHTKVPEVNDTLRINALWYLALEMTGQHLKRPHSGIPADSSGHHFERLAGRFRRSFGKLFWCTKHNCLCTPAARAADEQHHGPLPDPDQLLVAMLPVSPLPRTKQRQILARVVQQSLGAVGVRLQHPVHGVVESPLHRAWLSQGVAIEDAAQAAALAGPLAVLWDAAHKHTVHTFYRDGKAVPPPPHRADALASAEVLGVLERFHVRGKRGE